MLPPSDNELDKLITDASDSYEANGAIPNWDEMELMLEQHMPVKKDPRRRIFYILFFLFLLLGSGYLYFINVKSSSTGPGSKKSDISANASKIPAAQVDPVLVNPGKNIQDHIPDLTTPGKNVSNQQGSLLSQKSIATIWKKGSANININQPETGENNTPVKDENIETVPAVNEKPVISTGTQATPVTVTQISPADSATTGKKEPRKLTVAENKIPGDTTTSGNTKKPAVKNKKGWEISLVYAPEVSTIRFAHLDKPGSSYGLLLGYRMSNRITLQTGLIKSRKNYTANGDDYKINYWVPANYKLSKVNGYCEMIEIPLNIKYQVSGGNKMKFFATGGISSYFMNKQFYTFHSTTNNLYSSKTYTYNSQKNYWLSVATIGLGLQKNISKNFNVAVSPFMKIPFKNMGEGDLKIISSGVLFSLTYKP